MRKFYRKDKLAPTIQESKFILNHLYNYGINEKATNHVHKKIVQSESQKFNQDKTDLDGEKVLIKQRSNVPKSYHEWINTNFRKKPTDNKQIKTQELQLFNILQNDPETGELLNYIFEGFFNEALNEHDKILKRKEMVIDFLGD